MIKLYLDIDGVLLTAKQTQAAPGVDGFVDFITTNFACYWLTTHCKGSSASAIHRLAQFLPSATLEKLRVAVQPTTWATLKTEAIDLQSDFYWLDDQPFQAEIASLQASGVSNRLLVVNLNQPEALLEIQATLQKVIYHAFQP